jgi:hypothetical protein
LTRQQHPTSTAVVLLLLLLCAFALVQDIAKKYPDGLPQLDPVTDMGVQEAGVMAAIQQMNVLEQQLAKNPGEWWA